MDELAFVVPSRNRAASVRSLIRSFNETCTEDTSLVISIDHDDPQRAEYFDLVTEPSTVTVDLVVGVNSTMAQALNRACRGINSYAVGFMGDDHRPRTRGWDKAYLDTLRDLGTGIVYGNDLLQGERLPTQVAMTSNIVQALGYMTPPGLGHMYLDNFWFDLGKTAGCLVYLPDVVVEHLHPVAGKAQWDADYARVNDAAVYSRDRVAYQRYIATGGLRRDAEKVKTLHDA